MMLNKSERNHICSMEDLKQELKSIVDFGLSHKISESRIQELIDKTFRESTKSRDAKIENPPSAIKNLLHAGFKAFSLFLCVLIAFIALVVFLSTTRGTNVFFMRYLEDFIYPTMKTVRLLCLPVIRTLPWLTHYYTEKCLIDNPFFEGYASDCLPCSNITTVVDLTGHVDEAIEYAEDNIPFVVRDAFEKEVTLETLREVSKEVHETEKFSSSFEYVTFGNELLNNEMHLLQAKDVHIAWKTLTSRSARVLRKTFRKPYFVPNYSEVALRRYVILDGPESPPYILPLYEEFDNRFLIQVQGYRLVVLEPTTACESNCSRVSVLMKPKHVLYYSRSFYRATSRSPRLSNDLSITYYGSFY